MKYIQTNKECEEKFAGRVCSQCGRQIVAIETVDNIDRPTFWPGCSYCCKFDGGTKPEIQKLARYLVIKRRWIPYKHMDDPYKTKWSYKQYWFHAQIGGAVSMINDVLSGLKSFEL